MTKIIGLTGGIGSGKSTIAGFFKAKNIPIYIADDEARKLSNTKPIIDAIKNAFGTAIFDGEVLNRKKLGNIVFNNPSKLKLLNTIIHPAVRQHFANWYLAQKNYPIVIYESAILFESNNYDFCHKIIAITAPIETRIERVCRRDNTNRNDVLNRINNQISDNELIAKSDFWIENIDLKSTELKVNKIVKKLLNL